MKRLDDRIAPPLPTLEPIRLVDRHGRRVADPTVSCPSPTTLTSLLRAMIVGRRFDRQAGALARQGRLAVYPSSYGQEACQVAGVLALAEQDWLFPTYRDSVALVTRGVDPVETLTLLRGDWHSGYDPGLHRCAPQCTPLATNASHAVGLTYAARHKGEDVAALVLMGDGATSEGDAHEAYNFAAVWNTPVVFLVQNNGWAISVPLHRQSAAPTLAHKAVGYGMRGYHVDGNDAAAVHAVVGRALEEARAGGGPAIVEARTYRLDAHTNADAPQRYRDDSEVEYWKQRDPIERLETLLRAEGHVDDDTLAGFAAEAERMAADVRERVDAAPDPDPDELFAHVYAAPTAQLVEQRQALRDEIREG
ncbi:thiamine pyrophosphate-dependent dehydrogenase E1 component subunit alpha [Marinactinospora thermotolerans]|uniref:2-oxoisovalerate dehydrogenase subunit alpha n=1 Tax=Marinactinospora thermotolerans DSM 45154 TaxID=1122192 RepID=A0A1T4M2P0_9ACTN|nr:thiamine pyrophosphate-dependent dehydrogenase E1 component subunit alpha [Marinactinospora thermotolerans]SJZ61191.1 pyruvate dehydrogenase E1 component alpha subunit [Marinactinospora thermotolerans DSM 45154]